MFRHHFSQHGRFFAVITYTVGSRRSVSLTLTSATRYNSEMILTSVMMIWGVEFRYLASTSDAIVGIGWNGSCTQLAGYYPVTSLPYEGKTLFSCPRLPTAHPTAAQARFKHILYLRRYGKSRALVVDSGSGCFYLITIGDWKVKQPVGECDETFETQDLLYVS